MAAVPRSIYAVGMLVQALGAAATFATGVVIAWIMGPAAQGEYGLLRATTDLLLMLALFGLPQSLVFAVHQQGASPALLARTAARYGGVLFLLWCGAVALTLVHSTHEGSDSLASPVTVLAMGIAVCGLVVQGLWRALVLVLGNPTQFAWSSVQPALMLLVAVLVVLGAGATRFEWALAASGLGSLLLSALQLQTLRRNRLWFQGVAVPLSGLAYRGTLAMVSTVAIALQPWVTLVMLRHFGASSESVGLFVFSTLVQQAFALPASFMSPLLLERVSRATGVKVTYRLQRLLPVLAATTGAALAAILLLPWLVPWLFGTEYIAAVAACIWMAASGPFIVAGRLMNAVLLGRGAFRASALLATVRAVAVLCAVPLALAAVPNDHPASAAIAWLIVEVAIVALATALAFRDLRKNA